MSWIDRLLGVLGVQPDARAPERVAFRDELLRRAVVPDPVTYGNEARSLCVGWLVDWLNTEPADRRVAEAELRLLCGVLSDPPLRRTIAAAATFAGFDVEGGAYEDIARETSHAQLYDASYHIPVVAFLPASDLPEARRIYARLAEFRPDDVRTPIGLAGLSLRDGNASLAAEHADRALELANRMPYAHIPLGRPRWEPALLDYRATLLGPDALSPVHAAAARELAALAARGEVDALRARLAEARRSDFIRRDIERQVCGAYRVIEPDARRLLLALAMNAPLYSLPVPFPGEVGLRAEAAAAAAARHREIGGWG